MKSELADDVLQALLRWTGTIKWADERAQITIDAAEFRRRVFSVASRLKAELAAINTDQRAVGICARNSLEWIVVDISCILLSVETVVFHADYVERHIEDIVGSKALPLLIVDAENISKMSAAKCKIITTRMVEEWSEISEEVSFPPNAGTSHEVFTRYYSSGTSGKMKRVRFLVDGVRPFVQYIVSTFPAGRNDTFLSVMPLSILSERLYVLACVMANANIAFTSVTALIREMPRLMPTMVVGVPAIYDMFVSLYAPSFYRLATERRRSWFEPLLRRLEARRLRKGLGGRVRYAFTGSALLKTDTRRALAAANIPVFEGYGLSEVGLITLNTPAAHRLGSVGRPLPDKKVWLENEEICLVALRRYSFVDQEDVSPPQAVIRTGDRGHIDSDGFVYLKGRMDDVIVLSNGKKMDPQQIEIAVKGLTGAESCVLAASASVQPVLVIFGAKRPASNAAIAKCVADMTEFGEMPNLLERILKCTNLPTRENGLLTTSLKIDRGAILLRADRALRDGVSNVDALPT